MCHHHHGSSVRQLLQEQAREYLRAYFARDPGTLGPGTDSECTPGTLGPGTDSEFIPGTHGPGTNSCSIPGTLGPGTGQPGKAAGAMH
jgi:hypothetical protein